MLRACTAASRHTMPEMCSSTSNRSGMLEQNPTSLVLAGIAQHAHLAIRMTHHLLATTTQAYMKFPAIAISAPASICMGQGGRSMKRPAAACLTAATAAQPSSLGCDGCFLVAHRRFVLPRLLAPRLEDQHSKKGCEIVTATSGAHQTSLQGNVRWMASATRQPRPSEPYRCRSISTQASACCSSLNTAHTPKVRPYRRLGPCCR